MLLRPIWYCDSPVGLADGSYARIGSGLLWFQGVEVRRAGVVEQVAVRDLPGWIDRLDAADGARARTLFDNITAPRPALNLGGRVLRFDTPLVMGIVNMTPDSFSDGGRHIDNPAAAAQSGLAMMAAGAAIIDVGGESTRPGAQMVWEGDEIARVVPVIERLAAGGAIISIDTRKAAVMEAALNAGAHIVNDISALAHDPRSIEVVARAGCPVMLMHSPSAGADPHVGDGYDDVVGDIFAQLETRIIACIAGGIAREKIIVDPGLGFGKSLTDNLAIVNRLATFHALGVPVLFGASRKRIIGALSNEAPVGERLGGSVALAVQSVAHGAHIVRVHDVAETVQALNVWRGLRDGALVAG